MTKIQELIDARTTLKSQTENPLSETYIEVFIKVLQSLQEEPTYEQGFERGKQIGYKEGWRAKSLQEPIEEREMEATKIVAGGIGNYCTCNTFCYDHWKVCPLCQTKIKWIT